jgi:hypothetical protein
MKIVSQHHDQNKRGIDIAEHEVEQKILAYYSGVLLLQNMRLVFVFPLLSHRPIFQIAR